jgi:hypothetical protein
MWFSSPAGSGLPKLLVALVQAIEGVLPWQTFSKVSALVLQFFPFFFITRGCFSGRHFQKSVPLSLYFLFHLYLFYYEGMLPWKTFSEVSTLVL